MEREKPGPKAKTPYDERSKRAARLYFGATVNVSGVPAEKIKGRTRGFDEDAARSALMYVLHRDLGLGIKVIGGLLGRHHSTVLDNCQLIESEAPRAAYKRRLVERIREEYRTMARGQAA